MRTRAQASDKMPSYIYMPLPDGKADVFIYKLISADDEGYIYETNEFRTAKVTEAEVAKDPYRYLDYEKDIEKTESKSETETNIIEDEQGNKYEPIVKDGKLALKLVESFDGVLHI